MSMVAHISAKAPAILSAIAPMGLPCSNKRKYLVHVPNVSKQEIRGRMKCIAPYEVLGGGFLQQMALNVPVKI